MMFAAFSLNPFMGLLLDRIKHKELFGVFIGIVCTVNLILLPLNINYIIITMSILGIFCCSFAPLTFTLAPQLVKKEFMPLAFGIVSTTSYMGMFAGPYLTGFVLDTTQDYTYGYWSVALYFLLAGVMMAALFFNSIKRKRSAQDEGTP
jgi:MFS family permease